MSERTPADRRDEFNEMSAVVTLDSFHFAEPRNIDADEETLQRAYEGVAVLLPCALLLALIQQHVMLAYDTELEWRIEHHAETV